MEPTLDILITVLSNNIWVGLLAILIFGFWKSSPKIYQAFEKYLASKKEEISNIGTALRDNAHGLSKVGDAIHSFEKALLGTEARIIHKIVEIKDEIKDEIQDDKIKELANLHRIPCEDTRPPASAPIIKRRQKNSEP